MAAHAPKHALALAGAIAGFSLLGACGGGARPATDPSASHAPAPPATPPPTSSAEQAETPPAPSNEASKGAGNGKTAATTPTEDALRKSKALEEAFPELDAVTKELGEPFAKGKSARRQWWYEKQQHGKVTSCDTIDLIRGPTGHTVVDVSVYTSDECKKVTLSSKRVVELLATLSGKPAPTDANVDMLAKDIEGKAFEETSALFEKKAGKPREAGERDFAAWKYQSEGDGTCRLLMLTSRLGSGASQVIWDLPCE